MMVTDSYAKALALTPDDPEMLLFCGIAFGKLGMHKEARDSFTKAVGIDRNDANAWYFLGVAQGWLGRDYEALDAYTRSTDLAPNDDTVWFYTGVVHAKLRHYREAVDAFDKAVEIDNTRGIAWVLRGVALENLKRYGTLSIIQDKAARNPVFAEKARHYKECAPAILSGYREIPGIYGKSFYVRPEYSWRATKILGAMIYAMVHPQPTLSEALGANPHDPSLWLAQATTCWTAKRWKDAVDCYDNYIHLKTEQTREARRKKKYERKHKINPGANDTDRQDAEPADSCGFTRSDASNFVWRGDALMHLGRIEEAIASFNRALALDPGHELAKEWRVKALAMPKKKKGLFERLFG
jgi:tetratricopeptide (TPR) repeat protein